MFCHISHEILLFVYRTISGQNASIGLLESIYNLERDIGAELAALSEYRVYPSAELAIIRKEVKAFKDHQESVLQQKSGADSSSSSRTKLDSNVQNDGERSPNRGAEGISGYNDLVNILNLENKLCVRKLNILSSRRQEEEDFRTAALRKQAKQRALEDNQSKDPANFRNQNNRF
jgi:hypothetical protein